MSGLKLVIEIIQIFLPAVSACIGYYLGKRSKKNQKVKQGEQKKI